MITGFVPDLAVELEGADVIVVPLKGGSGTNLKVLEGFAHQVPVVSTSVGAAGLGVASGRELLVADDPESFAEACCRLLADSGLRESVVTAAYDLVAKQYDWTVIERRIADLVGETIAAQAPSARERAQ